MIRAIIFDLDETLVDRAETMRRFLIEQYQRFPEISHCSAEYFAQICLRLQENGYADKLQAYTKACGLMEVSNREIAGRLFEDYKHAYGQEPVLFSGVTETLELLHGQYKLGIISNGRTQNQMAKIKASGIKHFFSSIFISEKFGRKKPDESIFYACLNDLSVSPSEAVFVGDNPTADIEPAVKLDMAAVWVKNGHYAEPKDCHGVISNLAELPSLIVEIQSVARI